MFTLEDFDTLPRFRLLGSGKYCSAYWDTDSDNLDDVYLVVDQTDRTREVLVALQGMPYIPKMQRLYEQEGYIVYLTEYSNKLPDRCNDFQTLLYDCGLDNVTSGEAAKRSLDEFIMQAEALGTIPESILYSMIAVWDKAKELFGRHVCLDMPPRNFGYKYGKILLRDILWME